MSIISEEYKKIEKIFKEYEGITFNMAILWLLENGFTNMATITDEEIAKIDCPKMFDDEFFREILKLTRKMAQEISPYDLLKFAMVNPFLRLDDFYNED